MVVLDVDLVNAFNMVDRQAMLDECIKHLPGWACFVAWALSCHSRLVFNGETLCLSEEGGPQGCPLTVILFCLVLKLVLDKVDQSLPLLRVVT